MKWGSNQRLLSPKLKDVSQEGTKNDQTRNQFKKDWMKSIFRTFPLENCLFFIFEMIYKMLIKNKTYSLDTNSPKNAWTLA